MTTPALDDPRDQLARALRATGAAVAAVRDEQWSAPTGRPAACTWM